MSDARASGSTIRWTGLCLDCADAEEMAVFYSRLLGWRETARDGPDWILMDDPEGGPSLSFQAEAWYQPPVWPEQGDQQAKMLHFEMHVDHLDAAVAHAIAAGAHVAPHQPPDRDPHLLRIMLDPAGHPFCLCADDATGMRGTGGSGG